MKIQFGFTGQEEIDKAKEELVKSYRFNNGTWMKKNIWFEKPHTGNYIKGYAYDDIEEVLSHETEHSVDTFQNMEEVESYTDEFDYSFSDDDITKFKKIFDESNTAYMIDGDIDDDKENLFWSRIEDGQYTWKGTVEEAYNELNEWREWDKMNNHVELLIVGILKK